jgi:hypothetical protein
MDDLPIIRAFLKKLAPLLDAMNDSDVITAMILLFKPILKSMHEHAPGAIEAIIGDNPLRSFF